MLTQFRLQHHLQAVAVQLRHLVELGQKRVQAGELAAEVDVAVEAGGVVEALRVGDLLQEALHAAPLPLYKVVHEEHVLLLGAEPKETPVHVTTAGEQDRPGLPRPPRLIFYLQTYLVRHAF